MGLRLRFLFFGLWSRRRGFGFLVDPFWKVGSFVAFGSFVFWPLGRWVFGSPFWSLDLWVFGSLGSWVFGSPFRSLVFGFWFMVPGAM